MRALTLSLVVSMFTACGEDAESGREVADTPDTTTALEDTGPGADTVPDTEPGPDSSLEVAEDTALVDTASETSDTFSDVDPESPLGGSRPARVTLPDDYDPATPHPLVILLHGYSATGQIQDLYLDFTPRATARGFIAVVPDGRTNPGGQQYWNASPGWCCDFLNSGVDDAGYLLGLVAEAKGRFNVDPARVYLVGHSNGGFMSYKLACEHAEVFAAMVSIAGAMPLAADDCAPSEPVAVLQVHGTFDAVINYFGTFGQYPSAETAVERWAGHNGCASSASVGEDKDYDNAIFGAETSVLQHRSCRGGAAELWKMSGSAHVPAFTPAFMPAVLDWLSAHPKVR